MQIIPNYSLKMLNTFGMDVFAEHFVAINSIVELQELIHSVNKEFQSLFVLGGGSNVLLTKDIHGLVIKNQITGISIMQSTTEHTYVKAGAGVVWNDLVQFSILNGLGGIENLSLIPGSVGAAPIQNIGAYGVELKDTFDSLEAVDLNSGEVIRFANDECMFGYRNSIFKQKHKGKFVIVSITLKLDKNPSPKLSYGAIQQELNTMQIQSPTVRDVSDAIIRIRTSKLPDPAILPNAGSFFKNPEISSLHLIELKKRFPSIVHYPTEKNGFKIAAGWMIEQCGWKGKRVGDCGSHAEQALVLVNYGSANGNDILQLAESIIHSVQEKFEVTLEPEVNIL